MSKRNRDIFQAYSKRRVLQSSVSVGVLVSDVVVVAQDGSGNFTRINDAVAAAPTNNNSEDGYFLIYVVSGVYQEYVSIPKSMTNLMMVGDGINQTVITGNRSVVDGWTTFNSTTFEMAPEPVRTPLGAVARELHQCISNAKDITRSGKTHLEQLDRTLKNVIPCIDEDKQFDGNVTERRKLDMDQLIAQIKESKVLVEKFTKTRPWNFHKHHEFSKKFNKLNEELLSFYQQDMQAEIWRYNKQIMEEMKEAQRRLNGRNQAVNDALLADVGNSSASAVPELSTGNDRNSSTLFFFFFFWQVGV